jgi:hypothetical protein
MMVESEARSSLDCLILLHSYQLLTNLWFRGSVSFCQSECFVAKHDQKDRGNFIRYTNTWFMLQLILSDFITPYQRS